jgi:putative intracellular protease/amidase
VGLENVVPFLLESRLRELGGVFVGTDDWQPFAVHDGQLVTGQNPQSSQRVAELLMQALRAPVSD